MHLPRVPAGVSAWGPGGELSLPGFSAWVSAGQRLCTLKVMSLHSFYLPQEQFGSGEKKVQAFYTHTQERLQGSIGYIRGKPGNLCSSEGSQKPGEQTAVLCNMLLL